MRPDRRSPPRSCTARRGAGWQQALAFTGFFLNLFNLAPISPLDGGRIVAAIHPALWLAGLAVLLGLTIVAPNPILILILVLGGLESWRRWQHRKEPQAEAYYRVTPTQRVVTGVAYIALAAPRNVVLFIADDLGQDAGCYGNREVQTPALDQLTRPCLLES